MTQILVYWVNGLLRNKRRARKRGNYASPNVMQAINNKVQTKPREKKLYSTERNGGERKNGEKENR
jgi:hypothetical protein